MKACVVTNNRIAKYGLSFLLRQIDNSLYGKLVFLLNNINAGFTVAAAYEDYFFPLFIMGGELCEGIFCSYPRVKLPGV